MRHEWSGNKGEVNWWESCGLNQCPAGCEAMPARKKRPRSYVGRLFTRSIERSIYRKNTRDLRFFYLGLVSAHICLVKNIKTLQLQHTTSTVSAMLSKGRGNALRGIDTSQAPSHPATNPQKIAAIFPPVSQNNRQLVFYICNLISVSPYHPVVNKV